MADQEATVIAELKAAQGQPADIGGYHKADDGKVKAVMRPSATFNRLPAALVRIERGGGPLAIGVQAIGPCLACNTCIRPPGSGVCRSCRNSARARSDAMTHETNPSTPAFAPTTAPMRSSARALAVRAEAVDTLNWLDNFAAAPAPVRDGLGLATHDAAASSAMPEAALAGIHATLAMVRSRIPFSHFNMVLNLGCPAVADDAAFEAIERFYGEAGMAGHWVLVNDYTEPADLDARLRSRGYAQDGAWERVVLQGARPELWQAHAQGCESVTPENAADWSSFILNCYRMPPPIADWLHALVGRPGWFHALRRAGGAEGAPVVMVRSLFMDPEGWAWLGIDAPIPGLMAPCHEDDQKVSSHLLTQAALAGAHSFVSDIELPDPARGSEAYRRWAQLGFAPAYLRRLFRKG